MTVRKASKPRKTKSERAEKLPRKRSATAGRRAKPWRTKARLDLLPLEHAVAKMLVQRTPETMIAAWVRLQPTFEETSDEKVAGLCDAIKARWAAVRDDPGTILAERAAHAAMLDAAIHDAWNNPVYVMTDNGIAPARNPDGTLATKTDHKAMTAYLRERREFYGFGAPQKHLHLHAGSDAPPIAALSPADREAEIRKLLERRQAAMLARGVIDVQPAESTAMVSAKKK